MDDLKFGTRNKRGDFTPNGRLETSPLFTWPPRPMALLRWFAHYLHHKYFEVNYGGDGVIPLDKWFGTWHDGSKDSDAQMNARFERKKARMNAGK